MDPKKMHGNNALSCGNSTEEALLRQRNKKLLIPKVSIAPLADAPSI
jgi:hypothetical protein